MADLAELTGAPRHDVIKGHILSPLTLLDLGELEQVFEARHITRGQHSGCGEHALEDVRRGVFTYGGADFTEEALKLQSLPTLAWMELRHNHPGITQEATVELIRACPDQSAVWEAVITLAGYKVKKKPDAQGSGSASSGTDSSQPSANPASPSATSAG